MTTATIERPALDAARFGAALSRARYRITWPVVRATLAIAGALQAWSMAESVLGESFAAGGLVSAVIANVSVAFCMLVTTFVADELVATGDGPLRTYAWAVVAGSAIGALCEWIIHAVVAAIGVSVPGIPSPMRVTQPAFVFFEYLIWGSIGVWIYVNRRNELRARARMATARLTRARTQRRALEVQLQALQAQVEPRFLLDTLARVRDRYDTAPAKGGAMLGALIAYLRTALPRIRESSSDLAREIDLVRAYVDVLLASGSRTIILDVDVPESVREARMPAMLLLPLTSLPTRGRGGTLSIRARQDADKLRVSIKQGIGTLAGADENELNDIRARLHALYGEEASLALVGDSAASACAIVEIPYERSDGGHR
jgi:hypothetical protein